MNRRLGISTALLFFAAAACTSTLPGDVVALTAGDNGREIVLKKGGALELTLESNPTTGYGWSVAEVRTAVLRPEGDPVYASSEPVRPGGGGTLRFRFRAVAAGQTGLKLIYRRSWETGEPPAGTFAVLVNVR